MLELFAGIGGISLAAEWAGVEIAGHVEIDPYCQKVLKKHWPDVPLWSDVFEITGEQIRREIGQVDIISGGFPCQPFSCAGKREGEKDDRFLWPEFHRIICEVRPKWVVGENVRGILSIDSGRVFGRILSDLAQSGYRVGWVCYGAADVGAPHQRERVFIVAHARCEGIQQRVGANYACGEDGQRGMGSDGIPQVEEYQGKNMGNASKPGLQDRRGPQVGQPGEVEEFERPGGGYAGARGNPSECGLCGKSRRGAGAQLEDGYQQLEEAGDRGEGPTQPRLGKFVDGISRKLDGGGLNDAKKEEPTQMVPCLRQADGTQDIQRDSGKQSLVQQKEILQSSMCGAGEQEGEPNPISYLQEELQSGGGCLRELWGIRKPGFAPQGRRPHQQRHGERYDPLRLMSYGMALGEREGTPTEAVCLLCLRKSWEGVGPLPKTLPEAKEVWESLPNQDKARVALHFGGRKELPTGMDGNWPAGWWPTPRSCEAEGGPINNAQFDGDSWFRENKKGVRWGIKLKDAVAGAEKWPAGPGEQYEWEPPRIATGVKDRVQKLKGLGNAVCPPQIYPIFKAIMEVEEALFLPPDSKGA